MKASKKAKQKLRVTQSSQSSRLYGEEEKNTQCEEYDDQREFSWASFAHLGDHEKSEIATDSSQLGIIETPANPTSLQSIVLSVRIIELTHSIKKKGRRFSRTPIFFRDFSRKKKGGTESESEREFKWSVAKYYWTKLHNQQKLGCAGCWSSITRRFSGFIFYPWKRRSV